MSVLSCPADASLPRALPRGQRSSPPLCGSSTLCIIATLSPNSRRNSHTHHARPFAPSPRYRPVRQVAVLPPSQQALSSGQLTVQSSLLSICISHLHPRPFSFFSISFSSRNLSSARLLTCSPFSANSHSTHHIARDRCRYRDTRIPVIESPSSSRSVLSSSLSARLPISFAQHSLDDKPANCVLLPLPVPLLFAQQLHYRRINHILRLDTTATMSSPRRRIETDVRLRHFGSGVSRRDLVLFQPWLLLTKLSLL